MATTQCHGTTTEPSEYATCYATDKDFCVSFKIKGDLNFKEATSTQSMKYG